MKNTILACSVITMALSSFDASAWVTSKCLGRKLKWPNNTVRMRASGVSFAPGSWRDALTDAVGAWNKNPSKFQWNLTYGDSSVGSGNGQNEAWFTNSQGLLKGAPARALTKYTCINYLFGKTVKLKESDVIFDAGESYTTTKNKNYLWEYGGGGRSFRTTALHELGHALGLKHENREYNIMGEDWTTVNVNYVTASAYPGEDAGDAAVYLYGTTSSNRQDVSVVHWKRTGAKGQYSDHSMTKLYNSSNATLSNYSDSGERRYRLNPGQTIKAEFSFENNGKNTQNIQVAYYISTNELITTLDQKIGSSSMTLSRDGVFTYKKSLVIPGNMGDGKKYLGVIVDYKGNLSEVNESNNATYLPIEVL
ncbi:MAG: matrixin family metalloprotease [Bacteriovoracaceae bacterium]|jgi:hypothetical protein|nr:matrixin family metalloprotease [Bacteriovoracaceae bacterium]